MEVGDDLRTAVAQTLMAFLPGYAAGIPEDCRARYKEKLSLIGNIDPYELPKAAFQYSVDLWPATTYIHLGMHLIFTPSPYTGDQLLNYKSMECYQRFTSGWVRGIMVYKAVDDKRVVVAKVYACTGFNQY